jgi:NADPH-dependent glutamate synthase beta subunit-like oxidoreductase
MNAPLRDVASLTDLLHGHPTTGRCASAVVYIDLLPPCNPGCPAGESIQAWGLSDTTAGRHEQGGRELVADNPFPAIHRRVCHHACTSVSTASSP